MNEPERPVGPASPAPARRTPYELVFESDAFESSIFPRIGKEAASHGVDPLLPEQFAFLSIAGDAVREVLPPDAPSEALEEYRALLFHAFNFWRYGKRVYLLEPSLARYLVEAAPGLREWELRLPHPSLYLQLPPSLFWGSISADMPPEPVDGFFVSTVTPEDAQGRPSPRLDVLAVLGIRRDRAGFSVIPLDAILEPGIASVWAGTPARESGEDFETVLPGGDLARLYSILTTGEILKLLARALWYVDTVPEGVAQEAPPPPAEDSADAPPPPRLSYHRVSLVPASPPDGTP